MKKKTIWFDEVSWILINILTAAWPYVGHADHVFSAGDTPVVTLLIFIQMGKTLVKYEEMIEFCFINKQSSMIK